MINIDDNKTIVLYFPYECDFLKEIMRGSHSHDGIQFNCKYGDVKHLVETALKCEIMFTIHMYPYKKTLYGFKNNVYYCKTRYTEFLKTPNKEQIDYFKFMVNL